MVKAFRLFIDWIKSIDPRYYLIANHTILLSCGMLLLSLKRTPLQIAVAVGACIAVELIMSRITMKQGTFDIKSRIMSSLILGLSSVILVRSYDWWFYGVIAIVGVLSKYLFVNHNGRHIFNPTNVAVLFAVIVLPEAMVFRPDTFAGHPAPLVCITIFGLLATIRADVWRVPLGYVIGLIAIGIPLGHVMGFHWLMVIGPEITVSTFLFMMLMITDPLTCPENHKEQLLFGILVAVVNLFLKYQEMYYTLFMALFIVTAFGPLIFRSIGKAVLPKPPIKTAT